MFARLRTWIAASTVRIVIATIIVCAPLSVAGWIVVGRTYRAFAMLHADHAQIEKESKRLDDVIQFLNTQIAAAAPKK